MHGRGLPALRKGGDLNSSGIGASSSQRGGLDSNEHSATTPPNIALGAAWCPPSALHGSTAARQSPRQFYGATANASTSQGRTSTPPPLASSSVATTSPLNDYHASTSGRREGTTRAKTLYTQATKDEEVEEARRENAATRKKKIEELGDYLVQYSARHLPETQRTAAVRKTLEDTAALYPNLKEVLLHVSRYVKEMSSSMQTIYTAQAAELSRQEKELYDKYESFFEGKIFEILKDKKKVEERADQLQKEVLELRRDRDEDLSGMKEDLIRRLNACEQREDEFRSFRQLIAAVFHTNQELTDRIDTLEELLKKHRIAVPAARSDLFAYSKKNNASEEVAPDDIKRITSQVPVDFIAASKEEMALSRLTLQKELLQSAFDDRTAYRMQVNGFKAENAELQFKVATLQQNVVELNRYIYEKRFLTSTDEAEDPKTPRPRDVPFSIQTELGIDLRKSTSDIVAELAAVATNMKHQLNSALLRLRQSTTVAEWMDEETLLTLDADHNEVGVLPTYPAQQWPHIPHFLRTLITPDVPNLRWSEADTGALMLELFDHYEELRADCRYMRDSKMVQPRTYQLYERKEHVLTRLDASKAEVEQSEENVPFGYVVSHFINKYLLGIGAGSQRVTSNVILPGTLQPRFTVRGEERVVELELTRFAYNLWWAAQRYTDTQPLCRLFIAVINGAMPLEMYRVMKDVLHVVKRHVAQWDASGGNSLTYGQLITGTLQLVQDMDAQAGRGAVLACAQSFEETSTPITGGRIGTTALLADETCVVPEPSAALIQKPTTEDMAAPGMMDDLTTSSAVSKLPPTITARRVLGRHSAVGASVFVRFWRRLTFARYERIFRLVERILSPLVRQSEMVRDLYLLPVPEAYARLGRYDEDPVAKGQEGLKTSVDLPNFEEDAILSLGVPSDASMANISLREINKHYVALFKDSMAVVRRRQVTERTLLSAVGRAVLEGLPRLNRSVHFPFDVAAEEDDTEEVAESTAGASAPLRKSRVSQATPIRPNEKEKEKKAPSAGKAKGKSAAAKKGKKEEKPSAAPKENPTPAPEEQKEARRAAASPPATEAVPASTAAAAAAAAALASGGAGEGLPEDLFIKPDKEMVEWFGFCSALRSKLPVLDDALFQHYIKGTNDDEDDATAGENAEEKAAAAAEKSEEVDEPFSPDPPPQE